MWSILLGPVRPSSFPGSGFRKDSCSVLQFHDLVAGLTTPEHDLKPCSAPTWGLRYMRMRAQSACGNQDFNHAVHTNRISTIVPEAMCSSTIADIPKNTILHSALECCLFEAWQSSLKDHRCAGRRDCYITLPQLPCPVPPPHFSDCASMQIRS